MSRFTMIGRIWLSSGIRRALCCCTVTELRWVLQGCEEYLAMPDRGAHERAERPELEDWRRIMISEIQRCQIEEFAR